MDFKKPKGLFPDLTEEAALGFFVSKPLIIGVDEVGRGCLAGPVVAGAAVLNPEVLLDLGFQADGARPNGAVEHPLISVKDSKLIPEKFRFDLAQKLSQVGVNHAIGEASVGEIGELNILYASQLAMERAVEALEKKIGGRADLILVDGNQVPKGLKGRAKAIVKGDLKSLTIACASVFAKVHRDELMDALEERFPGYGLKKHKGYPTPFHKARIKELGSTEIHRAGFKGVI
jgi:ribonuclease HII